MKSPRGENRMEHAFLQFDELHRVPSYEKLPHLRLTRLVPLAHLDLEKVNEYTYTCIESKVYYLVERRDGNGGL